MLHRPLTPQGRQRASFQKMSLRDGELVSRWESGTIYQQTANVMLYFSAKEGAAGTCSSTVDVESMSARELKEFITQNGLSHADCSEKSEYQDRARKALQQAGNVGQTKTALMQLGRDGLIGFPGDSVGVGEDGSRESLEEVANRSLREVRMFEFLPKTWRRLALTRCQLLGMGHAGAS